MTIRAKLIATFAFMVALILLLGGVVLSQLTAMNEQSALLTANTLPAISQAALMKERLIEYRSTQVALVTTPDAAQRAAGAARLLELEATFTALLADYRALGLSDTQQLALDELGVLWAQYVSLSGAEALRLGQDVGPVVAQADGFNRLLSASTRLSQLGRISAAAAAEQVASAYDTARSVTLSLIAIIVMFGAVVGFSQALDLSDALRTFQQATRKVAQGDLATPIEIQSSDELGALADDFRALLSSLRAEQAAVHEQQRRLSERNAELERANQQLEAAAQERAELSATVRALATPVLPVHKDTLVVPLIGVVDSARAGEFSAVVLEAVETRRARTVIIDVTGLAVIDSYVARTLLQTATAVRLLGARTLVAGIKPEVAQALIGLDIGLDGLYPSADLERAVSYAIGRG